MRTLRLATLFGTMAFLAAGAACGDDGGPGDQVNVAGSWVGTALLPTARTASMTLQQTGSAVSGEMSLSGVFVDRTVTGEVNSTNRTFSWMVASGCDLWSGVLNIDAPEENMSGAVLADGSGCEPPVSNASGTLTLAKQ